MAAEHRDSTSLAHQPRSQPLSPQVSISLKLRCAMDTVHMTGYIVPDNAMPDGVDVLVGKPIIKSMGSKPDSRNMRIEFTEVKSSSGIPMVINTMPLEKQLDVFDSEPLRILDICVGDHSVIRNSKVWAMTYNCMMT